jgi:hypothetical protein
MPLVIPRISLRSCVALFIGGWFIGSLLVFTFFHGDQDFDDNYSPYQEFSNSATPQVLIRHKFIRRRPPAALARAYHHKRRNSFLSWLFPFTQSAHFVVTNPSDEGKVTKTNAVVLQAQTLPVFAKKPSSSGGGQDASTTSSQSSNRGKHKKGSSSKVSGAGSAAAFDNRFFGGSRHNHVDDDSISEPDVYIYMDWPVDDRLFTVENYKALESLLTVYPNAVVRVLLATSSDAWMRKVRHS